MVRPSEVLARYELLAGTVAHMVALAADRQWEHLPALDARCTALYRELHEKPPEGLFPEELQRVVHLTSRIRGHQETLQRLVQPQFLQLAAALRSAAQEQPPA
jgi:hypothetical protein